MNRRFLIVLGLALAALLAAVGNSFRQPPTQVTFFSIGQGDSALIQTAARQNILIDGGPDRSVLTKLGSALPWGDKQLDLVVLSHPHADHVTGLTYVLERYKVGRVLMNDAVHTTPEYLRFLELVKEKNIPVTIGRVGQRFLLDGGVTLEVLWPQVSFAGAQVDDLNATSIVNRVSFGQNSVLFTGDTTDANEQAMLQAGVNLKADILKVAHHGSRTSTSREFIKAAAPQVAVVSAGANNSYGHPHAELIERLNSLVPAVLRTDQDGDIIFRLENGQWVRR